MAPLIHSMAYVNAEPWHGLGNQLPANQPIEVWQQAAGMVMTDIRVLEKRGGKSGQWVAAR